MDFDEIFATVTGSGPTNDRIDSTRNSNQNLDAEIFKETQSSGVLMYNS